MPAVASVHRGVLHKPFTPGLAYLHHCDLKLQRDSGQWVARIDGDLVPLNGYNSDDVAAVRGRHVEVHSGLKSRRRGNRGSDALNSCVVS